MLQQLESPDWEAVFGFAGEEGDKFRYTKIEQSSSAKPCSTRPFTREDVAELTSVRHGTIDGMPWLICGRLRDDRWFFIKAEGVYDYFDNYDTSYLDESGDEAFERNEDDRYESWSGRTMVAPTRIELEWLCIPANIAQELEIQFNDIEGNPIL